MVVRLGLLDSPGWWLTRLRQTVCVRAHWPLQGSQVHAIPAATPALSIPTERPLQVWQRKLFVYANYSRKLIYMLTTKIYMCQETENHILQCSGKFVSFLFVFQGVYVECVKLVGGRWTGTHVEPLDEQEKDLPMLLSLSISHTAPPVPVVCLLKIQ